MRVAFIVKSTIRNKRNFYEQVELLRSKNIFDSVLVFETEYARHAIELGHKMVFDHLHYVIAVGGDGTLNEVVNGMLGTGLSADELPAVGILPYGSANDFSKTLEITTDFAPLIEWMEKDKTRPIDIGEVSFIDEDGVSFSRYFINILDAGIGAIVVKKVNKSTKPLGAKFAFVKAITESFLTYSPSEVTAKIGDKQMDVKILTLAVANGKYFGNGLCIAPDAKPDDNSFQVVFITDISLTDYALNLRKLRNRERIDHPKIHYFKASEVELFPKELSVSVEADGEFVGYAPMKVKMHHNRIRFIHQESRV
jgi:diacylglycerol kinase (ATP)